MKPRIFLHLGYVISKYDKQRHFIGAGRLARLYGVPFSDCILIRNDPPEDMAGYHPLPYDIHLYPSFDGNYSEHIGTR